MTVSQLPNRLSAAVAIVIITALGLATVAQAEPTAAEVIEILGLEESDTAARDMPGWRAPTAVIVMSDGPERLDWYREVLPEGLTLLPARSNREAVQLATDNADTVTAAVGFCSQELADAGPNIRWFHMPFAGVAQCISIPRVTQGDHLVTNMQRLSAQQIAEHVIAMMLYFARGLDHFVAAQRERRWDRAATPSGQMWTIETKTMLIAGLGGIGTQTAELASGLGMRVIATRNSSRNGPDFVDYVGLSDELPKLMAEADVVVNALPLTEATTNLFNADLFARMKPTALFINVGRGGSVVSTDLVDALKSGTIAGAGLDVQDIEPMPEDHPLWDAPNLLITPHVSGFGDAGRDMFLRILRENLRRYATGDKMLSVVDIEKGY